MNRSDDPYALTLGALEERVNKCTKCPLSETRTHVVFGEGDPHADLMLVGEGPGEVEDNTGHPFVGPAGHKLDDVLSSVGISRAEIYITNVVKCRPPGNRVPTKKEMEACSPYLEAQIALVNPKLIITLGNTPTQWLVPGAGGITHIHGSFIPWRGGIEIVPMFHPSYLLRNPSRSKGSPKYLTWMDIKKVRKWLDDNGRQRDSDRL